MLNPGTNILLNENSKEKLFQKETNCTTFESMDSARSKKSFKESMNHLSASLLKRKTKLSNSTRKPRRSLVKKPLK